MKFKDYQRFDRLQRSMFRSSRYFTEGGDLFRNVVGPFMRDHVEQNYITKGAHSGKVYPGYQGEPLYRAWKKQRVGHLNPLYLTKTMEQSPLYKSLVKKGDPNHIEQKSLGSMVFGSRLRYAGRLARRGYGPYGEPYPERNPLQMSKRNREDLSDACYGRFLKKMFRGGEP